MKSNRLRQKAAQKFKLFNERKEYQTKRILRQHKYVTIRNASEQIINFQGKLTKAMSSEPLDSESEPEKKVPSTKKQKMDDNELPFSKDDVDKEVQESLGVESVGVGGVARGSTIS